MTTGKVERRLAAILAADVVGYSRLMEADEAGTLARLQALRRDVIDPTIAEHKGRIVKLMGDGALVEFASVVDAVACAAAIQCGVAERDSGATGDQRIAFRIGINLGDVIVEGDDIYGDGVNVAARLEGLAEHGGICVSADVYRQVRGKLELGFEDLGPQSVKNIAEPVHAYRVRSDDRTETPAPTGTSRAADRPGIAVLPFDNMSGDEEQRYFADGIAEDVITDLSQIAGLLVIARNSSFEYRGKSLNVQRIARELGVRYILEGSVRRSSDRVRITAQLIDSVDGGHVWAERFDRTLSDIFAVQDEVTGHIVSALKVKLSPDELQRMERKGTSSVEAHDRYLRGRELYLQFTRESNALARRMYQSAVERDPTYAAAHAELALTHITDANQGWSENPEESFGLAHQSVQAALDLDDSLARAHAYAGWLSLWRKQHIDADTESERALALDPNFADGYAFRAMILVWSGEHAAAIETISTAIHLNPSHPPWYYFARGHALFHLKQFDQAAELFRSGIARNPDFMPQHIFLASLLGHEGDQEAAHSEIRACRGLSPNFSLAWAEGVVPYKNPSDKRLLIDGLISAGLS